MNDGHYAVTGSVGAGLGADLLRAPDHERDGNPVVWERFGVHVLVTKVVGLGRPDVLAAG